MCRTNANNNANMPSIVRHVQYLVLLRNNSFTLLLLPLLPSCCKCLESCPDETLILANSVRPNLSLDSSLTAFFASYQTAMVSSCAFTNHFQIGEVPYYAFANVYMPASSRTTECRARPPYASRTQERRDAKRTLGELRHMDEPDTKRGGTNKPRG